MHFLLPPPLLQLSPVCSCTSILVPGSVAGCSASSAGSCRCDVCVCVCVCAVKSGIFSRLLPSSGAISAACLPALERSSLPGSTHHVRWSAAQTNSCSHDTRWIRLYHAPRTSLCSLALHLAFFSLHFIMFPAFSQLYTQLRTANCLLNCRTRLPARFHCSFPSSFASHRLACS